MSGGPQSPHQLESSIRHHGRANAHAQNWENGTDQSRREDFQYKHVGHCPGKTTHGLCEGDGEQQNFEILHAYILVRSILVHFKVHG